MNITSDDKSPPVKTNKHSTYNSPKNFILLKPNTTKQIAMKKLLLFLFVIAFGATLFVQNANAQIAVTVTNFATTTPALDATYPSLASAITAMNGVTVMTGPVIFDLAADGTETAPAGGYALGNATLNALTSGTNTITFQKSGVGANPLITAYSGGTGTPSTAVQDGIWRLTGIDYVTIDGVDLTDPNPANPATMEFGFGLFKLSVTDGCQYNTIQNCTVTLNRANFASGGTLAVDGSRAINVVNALATAQTTVVVPTSATGTNSYNSFYGNTVQNCNYGIVIIGYAGASPFTLCDFGNDIGGSSPATGNNIINYGGGSGATVPSAGVRTLAQYNLNVSYNTVNNNNGSGVNHTSTLRGIYLNTAVSASATISYNDLSVSSGATTSQVSVIENVSGGTAAGNTINISYNAITGAYNTATSGAFYGIYNSTTPATININNNTISDVSYSSAALSGSGSLYMIYNSGSATNVNVNYNIINNIGRTGTTGGTLIGIYVSSGANQTVTNNTISNLSIAGTGTSGILYGIQTTTGTLVVNNNNINNLNNLKSTGTGNLYGIYNIASPTNENFNNNTVYNLSHAGTGTTYGIYLNTTSGTRTLSYNTVYGITSAGTTVAGLNMLSSSPNIFKNKIYDISSSSTGTAIVSGLVIGSLGTAGTANIYDNIIGDINAPSGSISAVTAPSVRGINITTTTTSSTLNVYYNTIYLNASSTAADFGTAGIYVTTNATPTNAALDLRNNLIVNNSTPAGTGLSSAYHRSSVELANYSSLSDNNLFYAGVFGPSNLIMFDGTNSYQTLADYKTAVATRDGASITEDPYWLSTTGSNAGFLHINTAITTSIESAGANIATYTDDFDGDIRQGNPGYPVQFNGGGTAPDIGADEFDGAPLQNCAGPPATSTIVGDPAVCSGFGTTLTLSHAYTDIGITFQWVSGTTPGGPYPNILGTSATQATGPLTVSTYYKCTITCTFSGYAYTTAEKSVLVNPLPTVLVTPADASYCTPGGSPVELTASGADTYSWSPAAGLDATTGAVVHASPAATTTYTVTGVDANSCSETATATVTAGTYPVVSATATPASICLNGSSQLQASVFIPSQVKNYSFAVESGATLDPMDGATQVIGTGDDDTPTAAPANIGFTFVFDGISYTQYSISPDGWILLGGATASNQFSNSVTSTTNIPKLYPYWDDLATGTTGNVKTLVVGFAPNRIFIAQWFVTIPRATSGTANSTMQAWLYEASGKIEFRYGTMGTSSSASVGLSGNTPASNFNCVTVATGTNSTVTAFNSNTGPVPDGTMYTFTPPEPTVLWTPNTFLDFDNILNPLASDVTETTVYTVTATNLGCSSMTNVTVSIASPLTCTNIDNTPACDGNDFTLTANTDGGGGIFNYVWSDGIGGIYPDAQSVTANLAGGSYTFSVTVSDACGGSCEMSQGVTVNPVPGGTAAGPSDGLTYISMLYSVTGYEAGSTFQWQYSVTDCFTDFVDIPTAVTDEVSLTASTAGTFYIHCVVTGTNGCITITNCITTVVTVNGDNVCSAIPLTVGLNGPFSSVGATTEAGEPVPPGIDCTVQNGWCTSGISNTVWFSFVAPSTGRVSIGNNANFNLWDNQFALYSAENCGDFLSFTLLAANDDSTTSISPYKAWIAPICLIPGTTYYLQVDGYSTTTNDQWGINLVVEPNAAPVISDCPANISVPASAAGCSANVSWTPPTASDPDNCLDPLSFTSNYAPGANFPLGITTVTYTANDGVNPDVTCSFTVEVVNVTVAEISGDLVFCDGSSTVLDAGAFSGYIWSTGETTQTITVSTEETFTVTVTDANGCTATASATTSTNPLPDVGLPVGGTTNICSGTGTDITVSLSVTGTSYQLRNDADNSPVGPAIDGDGGTIIFPTGILATSTTFNVLATIVATNCSAQLTDKVTITVDEGPVSTISTVYVCEGSPTVDIPVTVTSFEDVGSLSLTFGYNDTELTSPVIISRNPVFEGSWDDFAVTTAISGEFKVSGYGPFPGDGMDIPDNETLFTIRFNVVSGTVSSAVTFIENVQGTACEYTGDAPDYPPYCDIPTASYYFDGGVEVTQLGQVNDPADQLLCNGVATNEVIFTTNNPEGITTYTWTNNTTSIGLAASGTGNIPVFVALNSSMAPVVATITVTPHFDNGFIICDGLAETFTITVNPSGHVIQPISQVLCIGTSTSVTFETLNTGGITTYTWTNNTPGIGLATMGIGNIEPFNVENPGTEPLVATITVTPTFTNGVSCSGPIKSFTITVNPTGQVNDLTDQALCNGEYTTAVLFSTINSGGNTTYAWTNDQPGIGLAAGGSGDIASFAAINTGTAPVIATITVTPTFEKKSVSCTGPSKFFTITVNPTGQVDQPADQVVCNGTSTADINFSTNNTGGSTTYSWTNNETSIGLGANGTGDIPSFIAVNGGTEPVVATIVVTPVFSNGLVSCTGPDAIFTITVNPTGQVNQPVDQVVCNGSNTSVLFETNNTGGTTTYSWTNDTPGIGLASSGAGDISFTAINGGTAAVIATLVVTPHFTFGLVTCDGASKTFTITVNPSGQVNDVVDQVLCNGSPTNPVNFTTNNTDGTTTYTWTNDAPGIGLPGSGSGNIGSFIATNTGTATVVATITVTPHYENSSVICDGPVQTFTITVKPTGQVNQPDDVVVCNDSPAEVTFTTINTGESTTYAWTNDTPGIGLAASGNGNISFNAINAGTSPVVATIVVTPTFGNMPPSSLPVQTCVGPAKTFTITVNPTGQANQPSNQVVDNGSPTSGVTFGTINTGGITTYSWTNDMPGIGLAASGSGDIASFTAINTGPDPVVATIVVTPTFTNGSVGCPGPEVTFTITVNPKPLLVITNPSVCSPNRVDLTDPAVTAGSQLTYATLSYWYDAGATNPIPDPTSVGNGTYYIKATIMPGGWYDIKPVIATVNPLPTIYSGIGSGNYCANVPSITVGITGSQTGVNYTLWVGITMVSTTPIPGTGGPIYFDPIPPVAGQYWVLAENMTTHCINRMYNCVTITIDQPLPVSLTIAPSSNPSVADQDVTFTASPANGGTTPSYQWMVNGFNVGTNSSAFTYKPVNGDEVTCVLTSSESCVSGNPATSNTIVMSVTGVPVGNITVTGSVADAQAKCYNSLGTITVAGGGTTFIVNSGGSATMIAGQNIFYLPGTTVMPGGYMHGFISTTENCGVKAPAIVNTVTSTDEQQFTSQKSSFRLYPNPTTGKFTLELVGNTTFDNVRVELFGMTGEKIMTGEMNGEKKHEFWLSELPHGIYVVKVLAGDTVETIKLVITR